MDKLSETRVLRYRYKSREERELHVKYMEYLGYECTGQVRKTDNSLMDENKDYYWYGEFIANNK